MSRADWSFLEHLLEEGQEYSTGIGRVWLTVLFLFRMLALGTAAGPAWDDEQADFVCNTQQPGCTSVCYDRAFPISHFRYFLLQIIFVSTPTIFYFGYVAIRTRKDKTEQELANKKIVVVQWKEEKVENKPTGDDNVAKVEARRPKEPPKLKGRLLCAYTFSILLKVILEVAFIVGLWFLYDGFSIAPKYECQRFPCPHIVDCFVSRPTEKTIFTFYSQGIAAISLLLNIIELFHLLQLAVTHRLEKRYHLQDYRSTKVLVQQLENSVSITELPLSEEATGYSRAQNSNLGITSHMIGQSVSSADLLPSYSNYFRTMKLSYTQRSPCEKKRSLKVGPKANPGGRMQMKQYV
ncbi:gap junction alpha-4 protein isoform 1-T2 [Synchiropus picturatus]